LPCRRETAGTFLYTCPPFITNRTRRNAVVSFSGSPSTAMMSACMPGIGDGAQRGEDARARRDAALDGVAQLAVGGVADAPDRREEQE
jgi:hypothetical protein